MTHGGAGAAPRPPARPPARYAVPIAIDPAALAAHDPAAAIANVDGRTMGTGWSVRFVVPPRGFAGADAVAQAIQARLDVIDRELSHWSAESTLAAYHRMPAGRWMAVPPDFATVIAAGIGIAVRSGGAFDPAIGRVTDLWGLGPIERIEPPSVAALGAARAASGHGRLAFDGAARRLLQPGGLRLDLSGIAKGHAADAVTALLAEAGIVHALVEIGGECAGRGLRPDGDPWWVALETPPGAALAPIRVALHGLGVATSGDHVRGPHTIDPRTGLPVRHAPRAVSVIAGCCMIADAWATALTVLDPAEARAMAQAEGLAARIVDHDGGEWLSGALRAMIEG